jgi:hypothetical protein
LFAFRKAVKWELERRFPARYTASNCAFCTSRASRGYSCPALLGRKAMASLLAACRQDPAAAYGLHARAKSVRFGAAALARLICALWQSNPPLRLRVAPGNLSELNPNASLLAAFTAGCESTSVLWPLAHGQENAGVAYRAGKSDTPGSARFHAGAMRRCDAVETGAHSFSRRESRFAWK